MDESAVLMSGEWQGQFIAATVSRRTAGLYRFVHSTRECNTDRLMLA
jgi:hypothetical protein